MPFDFDWKFNGGKTHETIINFRLNQFDWMRWLSRFREIHSSPGRFCVNFNCNRSSSDHHHHLTYCFFLFILTSNCSVEFHFLCVCVCVYETGCCHNEILYIYASAPLHQCHHPFIALLRQNKSCVCIRGFTALTLAYMQKPILHFLFVVNGSDNNGDSNYTTYIITKTKAAWKAAAAAAVSS